MRRNIGYLPEGVPLYPEMRVREYLAYRARIKEVPERERRMRVEYVMDRCGVADAERKLIGSLSKGYRQRVGLADALVNDPPVLILDEPTIGLDPNQVRLVRDLIRDLGQKHTVLLSTHILPEVEMVCGRVIIIQNGKLVFQDTLANIARQSSGGGKVVVEARVGPGRGGESGRRAERDARRAARPPSRFARRERLALERSSRLSDARRRRARGSRPAHGPQRLGAARAPQGAAVAGGHLRAADDGR